jgi:predicted transcriptional regulator
MIEHLFGSKTRLKVLRLFFKKSDESFYVREITRLIGSQINAVRRELANLEKSGVIMQTEGVPDAGTRGGRQKYYTINKDCLLYGEIKALLEKSQLIDENNYIEEIKNKAGKLSYFVLTGIFVNNKVAPTDMLLVGAVKLQTLDRILKKFERELGQNVRYTIMTTREYNERKQLMDKFLYELLEGPVVEIVKNK